MILDRDVFVSGLVDESGDFLSVLRKRLERE
jgi:hypothetical protein